MVSICLLTIDRYWITRYTVETLLKNSGEIDIELLVLDNNSTDRRTIQFIEGLIASKKYDNLIRVITEHEAENIGVAKGFNKLFRQASGEYICTVGNDILLNPGWLYDLVYHNNIIEKSGLTAIHCVLQTGRFGPLLTKNDDLINVWKRDDNMVYGTMLFKKELLNEVGGFDETLSKYGCEDSQFAFRVNSLGYNNYYIPNQFSLHIGSDFGEDTEYRKEKDKNLKIATERLKETILEMKKNKNYKIPLNV